MSFSNQLTFHNNYLTTMKNKYDILKKQIDDRNTLLLLSCAACG